MLELNEALKILSQSEPVCAIEQVATSAALNRVLSEDILSEINMPPFNKAAMDGYAINGADESETFRMVETIAAGLVPQKKISFGECAKIMTGAVVPEGADTVVIREMAVESGDSVSFSERSHAVNVCVKGEDVKPGDRVLKKGQLLGPAEIGVLAAMGRDRVRVFKLPRVGVLVTGSEIVEPGKDLAFGQIYNSNGYSISAQVRAMGLPVDYLGMVRDSVEETRKKMDRGLKKYDILLVSGGVSMGQFDFVPGVLEEIGVELIFHKVAIKPGKPTLFGKRKKSWVFGMPGNPVSTYVIFEIFVKPFLFRMMGHDYAPVVIKARMKQPYSRKKNRRTAFVPVKVENGFVELVEYHGSAHLFALPAAGGIIQIERGISEIPAGAEINVRQI